MDDVLQKDIKHCVLPFYIVIQVNFTLPTGHVTFLLILNVGQWVLFPAVPLSLHLTSNFICQLPKILQIFEAAQYFCLHGTQLHTGWQEKKERSHNIAGEKFALKHCPVCQHMSEHSGRGNKGTIP